MNLPNIVEIVTLFSVVIAAVGLYWGVRVYRSQMNAQLLLEYTKRFDKIMESFPNSPNKTMFFTNGAVREESDEITTVVFRYLNMCFEEYYLFKNGYLSKKIWSIWEAKMIRTINSPLVRREWTKLRVEFSTYSDFSKYIDNIQKTDP